MAAISTRRDADVALVDAIHRIDQRAVAQKKIEHRIPARLKSKGRAAPAPLQNASKLSARGLGIFELRLVVGAHRHVDVFFIAQVSTWK